MLKKSFSIMLVLGLAMGFSTTPANAAVNSEVSKALKNTLKVIDKGSFNVTFDDGFEKVTLAADGKGNAKEELAEGSLYQIDGDVYSDINILDISEEEFALGAKLGLNSTAKFAHFSYSYGEKRDSSFSRDSFKRDNITRVKSDYEYFLNKEALASLKRVKSSKGISSYTGIYKDQTNKSQKIALQINNGVITYISRSELKGKSYVLKESLKYNKLEEITLPEGPYFELEDMVASKEYVELKDRARLRNNFISFYREAAANAVFAAREIINDEDLKSAVTSLNNPDFVVYKGAVELSIDSFSGKGKVSGCGSLEPTLTIQNWVESYPIKIELKSCSDLGFMK